MFRYDAETGEIYWRHAAQGRQLERPAGYLTDQGRRKINMDYSIFFCHRLVWVMHNGQIPEGLEIDHIDGDRTNNRIENLRLVNKSQNAHNRRSAKGYFWHNWAGSWRAQIMINGKTIYLGHFEKEEDARAAYLKAKLKYHPTAPVNNEPTHQNNETTKTKPRHHMPHLSSTVPSCLRDAPGSRKAVYTPADALRDLHRE